MIGLYVEILSLCNQRCIYCYNGDNLNKNDKLSLDRIKELAQQTKSICDDDKFQITLSGGEPLLHPNFIEILDCFAQHKIKVGIITNLTLLDKNMAKELSERNIDIQITIDGTEKYNDISRGKGCFQKQIEGIKLLNQANYKSNLSVRSNLWLGNAFDENIKFMFELCQKYNINNLHFALAHKTNLFKDTLDNTDQVQRINELIEIMKKDYKDVKTSFDGSNIDFGCPFTSDKNEVGFNLKITPTGYVYPCQMFDSIEFSLGNIHSANLIDILNYEKTNNFLNLMRLRKYFIKQCIKCVHQTICSGGCPAKSYFIHNNLFELDNACSLRKKLLNKKVLDLIENQS